jgi:ketosteroid isomerase-like protein
VHPGWPPLRGWPNIRESWRGIFEHQGPLHIWPSETEVRLYGQTAEINCLENIDVAQLEEAEVICTRATNIFRLVAQNWKILEHYTMPLPPGHTRRLDPYSPN